MPLRRYQIRNEYGLADPELYRTADKDDPEALLEGVAMAGLVGVLRQLGDLAEFAAEIFHDLHEEMMTTASRGHGLMARVQQLEAEFPILEKTLLSQTNHSLFFSNADVVDWHPNLQSQKNLITSRDLPRFVMDSYEECRGPPRLCLLDKFDVAGSGACLKRYTDPSVFKTESSSSERAMSKIHREKRTRKIKKKGMCRNGETPEVAPTHVKLHQLLLKEHFENSYNDEARLVKLKRRQLKESGVDWKSGRSYMEKFLATPSPDNKLIYVTSASPMSLNMLDNVREDAIKILEIGAVSPVKHSVDNYMCSSPNEQEAMLKRSLNLDGMVVGDSNILQPTSNDESGQIYSSLEDVAVEKKMATFRLNKQEESPNGHHSDDIASEVDNYMDALTSMESETGTDNEHKPRSRYLSIGKQGTDSEENDELQAHFYDSQSIGNSSVTDENGSFKKNISNFSYSDTLSSVVDNAPSDDVTAKLLSSDGSCEAEVMDTQSTHLHVAVQLRKTECDNSVVPSYALSEKEKFPDLGEASTDSCLTSSFPELLQSDAGADIASAQYMGTQTEDMPSESVKSHLGLSENEEDCNRLTKTIALVPDDLSLVKNDLSMDSYGILQVDKLDHGYRHDVNFNSVFTFCNVSVSIPDDEHNDCSLNEEPQTDVRESSEILADGKIASSERHLKIVSIAPVDTYSGVLPEDLDSASLVAEPDSEVSKSEDGFVATKFTLEESSLTVDMLQATKLDLLFLLDAPLVGKLEVEQHSALACSNLQVEPGLEGIEVLCDDQQSYEGFHRMVNDEVRGTSSCGVDFVADDHEQEIHQSLTDELSKAVDGEDVVCGVPDGDCTKDDANEFIGPVSDVILSLPQNHTEIKESHAKVEDSDLKALHSTETISMEFCKELETQKQLRQTNPSSEILCPTNDRNTNSHESVHRHRDPCNGLEQNKPVSIEFERQKDMNDQGAYSCISSFSVRDFTDLQESESSFTVHQERENMVCSTQSLSELKAHEDTHELQVVTTDLESMQDGQRTCGNSYTYNTLDGSSVGELIYLSSGVCDSMTQTDVSILEKKDSETIPISQSHSPQDGEASIEHPETGTFLGQSLQSNGNLHAKEVMKDFEKQNFRTEQTHSSNSLDLKEYSTAAYRSSQEIPDESAVTTSLSHPAVVLDRPKQFVYPVEPIIPSLVPLPTQINFDEMPPMPPLPPMQWLGKGQPSSLGSRNELDGGCHVMFKPLLASRTDEKAQLGLHTSHQGILLPENPFFPAMDVKGGNPQLVSGFVTSDLRQPVQIVELPSTSRNSTGHFNYFPMEGSQAQNQFQTSCSRCTEDPSPGEKIFQHMNSSSQAPPTENVGNILDCVSLQEESVTLSIPPVAETSSKVYQSSPHNLEGMTMHSSIISSSPPFAETVQLQNNVLPSDIDVLDSSVPFSLSDEGKPNGQGSTKLPRPRNPLIDAVVAHDKSKLRKVVERVRPQLAPILDERDSLLEQIRTKSFNLKPAVTTRPSIQGPRTNLKVAAILEKANAIRQALAGSDEDNDSDSWSDS